VRPCVCSARSGPKRTASSGGDWAPRRRWRNPKTRFWTIGVFSLPARANPPKGPPTRESRPNMARLRKYGGLPSLSPSPGRVVPAAGYPSLPCRKRRRVRLQYRLKLDNRCLLTSNTAVIRTSQHALSDRDNCCIRPLQLYNAVALISKTQSPSRLQSGTLNSRFPDAG
jgi:hypothetical protein